MDTCETKITFFVACYNEAENIGPTLDQVLVAIHSTGVRADIVLVDDASSDHSVESVKKWTDQHPEVDLQLLVNEYNQGLAVNYVEAAFHGKGEYYRLVCGDNVESADALMKVISNIGKADVVLFYPVNKVRSWYRNIISSFYTTLINCISGQTIRYYNGGALLRRHLVMRWHSNSHGFGFQADLVTRLLDRNYTYIEVSLPNSERQTGQSKALTLRNFFSVVHTLLDIFIRRFAKLVYGRN